MRKRKRSIHEDQNAGFKTTDFHHTGCSETTTNETSIACNVIIPTDSSNQNTFSEPNFQSNPALPILENRQILTQDIISKIFQLDDQSLATVQQFMTQASATSSVDNLIPPPEYCESTTELSPFVPVGVITDINNDDRDMQPDNKPNIRNDFNLEQVFQVPDTMFGYIFNENTNNLVKVKLFQHSDGLQTYTPYEEYQESKIDACKKVLHNSADIKIEKAKTQDDISSTTSNGHDMQVEMPPQNKPKFRNVSAKWKSLRNRSLHSKFVKKFQHRVVHSPRTQTTSATQKLLAHKQINPVEMPLITNKGKGKYSYEFTNHKGQFTPTVNR